MMRHRLILAAALSFGLVGCTVRPGSFVGFPTSGTAVGSSPASQATDQAQAPVSQYGTLQLTIKWPERPTGYQTALIPTSTNALLVRVLDGATLVDQKTVARTGSETTASAAFSLKAANNLSVQVLAYRESNPVFGEASPIAQGTTNVNILPSKKTAANLSLTALIVPTITALSTNAGVPGDEVTLTGTNFGTGSVPVSVYFNGYVTVGATRSSETTLVVQVPPGTPTGKVVVKADGVSSESNMVFWVPKTVSLSTVYDFWDPSDSSSQIVLLGKSKQLSSSTTWETKLGETAEQYGTPPSPTWSSSDTTAGTVDSNGKFTAGTGYVAAGTSVRASYGSMSSSALKMIPEAVTFSLGLPTGPRVLGGKGQNSLYFKGLNTFSDGATNSYVTYSAASASIDWYTGRAIATDFESNGTIVVSAESMVDPDQKTTTDLTLSNYTVSTVVGDGSSGPDNGTGTSAHFSGPRGLGFDSNGNLYVADSNYLRLVTPTWGVTSPSSTGQHEGVCVAADGTVYVSDSTFHVIRQFKSGAMTVLAGGASSGSTDGVGTSARFNRPHGLALDSQGNLYVADYGNNRIRKIDTITGAVSTFAGGTSGTADGTGTGAKFSGPHGLCIDAAGNLYVSDIDSHRIRKITPAGVVTTLAGSSSGLQDGDGANAKFSSPTGLAVDPDGNVYVADFWNHRIRKVAPDGFVTTVAGFGPASDFGGGSFVDGIGTQAGFKMPIGVAVRNGCVYVVENGNYTLRLLQ